MAGRHGVLRFKESEQELAGEVLDINAVSVSFKPDGGRWTNLFSADDVEFIEDKPQLPTAPFSVVRHVSGKLYARNFEGVWVSQYGEKLDDGNFFAEYFEILFDGKEAK